MTDLSPAEGRPRMSSAACSGTEMTGPEALGGDSNQEHEFVSNSTGTETCQACNGSGVLWASSAA